MIKLAGSFEDRIEQPIELGKRYGKKPTNGFRGMQYSFSMETGRKTLEPRNIEVRVITKDMNE